MTPEYKRTSALGLIGECSTHLRTMSDAQAVREMVAALTAWLLWSFAHGMWCACAPICFRIWNRRGSASAREMRANWRSVKRAIG